MFRNLVYAKIVSEFIPTFFPFLPTFFFLAWTKHQRMFEIRSSFNSRLEFESCWNLKKDIDAIQSSDHYGKADHSDIGLIPETMSPY